MLSKPLRVAVYVDWQNVYRSARRAFGLESMPNEHGQINPYALARILAAGNGRGPQGATLVRLQVHRGLPSTNRDPIGYGANRRQAAAWQRENPDVVTVHMRPLRYPQDPSEPPVEKGVDVELALAAVEHVITDLCDIAVIFTHDSDLLPVVETLARIKDEACVETASWRSESHERRLRTKHRIFHHDISESVYDRVADLTNYAYKPIR